MKLWVLSDLHHDVVKIPNFEFPEADVVVLAGDIQNEKFVRQLVREYDHVVYVAGNHEFYGYDLGWRKQDLQNKFPGVFLDDDFVDIAGVRFLGSTLWTDYKLYGSEWRQQAMEYAQVAMNDHRKIGNFHPAEAALEHAVGRSFLENYLDNAPGAKTVVVTHHAPSPRSIHGKYKDDLLNAAFVSNLESLISEYQPTLWVHGHVHSFWDYQLGDTRIVCNPRGYGDENPDFNPSLVIEI